MALGPFLSSGEVKRVPMVASGPFHEGYRAALAHIPDSVGAAVVDLTNGLATYAGSLGHDEDKHVYSLAKLAPMLAAFRLRERLRNQFRNDPIKKPDELIAKIQKTWKNEIAIAVQQRIKFPDFPKLRNIFVFTGPPWEFHFRGEIVAGTAGAAAKEEADWQAMQKLEDEKYDPRPHMLTIPKQFITPLPFMQRLKLGIRMSDNMGAGSIASDIGMAYMFGVLVTEGFYANNRGLWLSNTYGYDGTNMGVEGDGSLKNLTSGATAISVAEYFTRLFHSRTLMDPYGLKQMAELLVDNDGAGHGFGTGTILPRRSRGSFSRVTHSKIGLGITKSEAALLEGSVEVIKGSFRAVRYIAVCLQATRDEMTSVFEVTDRYVKQRFEVR